jgi:transcriptional regulator with XRE-family HTH domain
MKPVVRKYKFPTLMDYFTAERDKQTVAGSSLNVADRDTFGKMGERLGVSLNTISRIANGLSDPSFALALAISRDCDRDPIGMGKTGMALVKKKAA